MKKDNPDVCYPIVYLSQTITDDMTVLDVGCGNKQYSTLSKNTVTVDAWDKVSPDFLIDLEKADLPFEENSFDCVFLIDIIEHLPRERGEEILRQCLNISKDKVYILTPKLWDSNEAPANNPDSWVYNNHYYNKHKSLWKDTDFPNFVPVKCRHDEPVWFGHCSKHQSTNG